MAEIDNEVLRPTGLTPSTPVEESPPPAAPSAPAEVAQPVEQPAATEEAEAPSTAQPPAAPTAETTEGAPAQEPPKKPSRGVQKALDRLTEERERERARADQATAVLAAVLQAQQQKAQLGPQPQAAQPPKKKEEYSDWESYIVDRLRWETKQEAEQTVDSRLGQYQRAAAVAQIQSNAQNQAQSLMRHVNESTAKAAERYSDWEEVVASDLPMSPSLAHAITLADDPGMVMHHLYKNPDLHNELLSLPPERQLMRIGQIASPPAPVVSKAPPPAKPIGGGKSSLPAQYTDDMTPEQHKAFLARTSQTRGLR